MSIDLISEGYRQEQAALHAKGNYGTASLQFGQIVTGLIDKSGAKSLLDYGCGSMCNLARAIRPGHDIAYQGYDPAVEAYAESPEPAELVCCIDVLEHIEPELLDNVLTDLRRLTQDIGFFTVHTGPAMKTLSDGRNAHLTQEPAEWWLQKLMGLFEIHTFQRLPQGFFVVVRRGRDRELR